MRTLALAWALVQAPSESVGIDQRLGARIDLSRRFADETGRTLRLEELFGPRPVLLAPVYYRCPMLCSQVLDGLAAALKPLGLAPGDAFDVAVFSIDPEETPDRAAAAKASLLRRFGRPGTSGGWRFLTGEAPAIRGLAADLGFRFRRDAATGLYVHEAGFMLLTPDGRLARYFLGIEYSSRDLRLSIVEAAQGRIGTLADRIALLCLRWDPSTGRYSPAVLRLVQAGGALTAAALGAWIARTLLRERRRRKRPC